MADLTSADVTHAEVAGSAYRPQGGGRMRRLFTLTFGASGDYPTGGVPLDKAKLGCPTAVDGLRVLGRTASAGNTNFVWEWNGSATAPKLLGFEVADNGASDVGPKQKDNEAVGAAQVLTVEVVGY